MSKLTDAIASIGDKIEDLSELRVQTVTGDVTAVLSSNSLSDLEDLLKPDGDDVAAAKLHLVLDTTIKFDGDSLNFIDVNRATPDLVALHKEAVAAGLTHRRGLVEMFKGLVD